MPSRYYLRTFIPNYYYHIYNRGANKQTIFKDSHDYNTFLEIIDYYMNFPNGKPLSLIAMERNRKKNRNVKVRNLNNSIEIPSFDMVVYCLMPNHFHFLIKQTRDPDPKTNITNFMRRLSITYVMYSKKKYERSGVLFEGKFKNILVNSEAQLLHLSKYIHSNPSELLKGSEPLENYPYSSYPAYTNPSKAPDWLTTKHLLHINSLNNPNSQYDKYVKNKALDDSLLKKVMLE